MTNKQSAPAPIGAPSNVVKLPYSVTRRAYTRRPRRLKNGCPEEQSILAAAAAGARGHILRLVEAPKTAHVRHSKPQHVADLAKAAHVQDSKTCSTEARVFTVTEFAMACEKLSAGERRRISEEIKGLVDAAWFRGFAQRLRETRIGLGISEADAARAAGCLVTTWRKYEGTGRGRCTFAVASFAKQYGVSLDDLLPAE